MDRSFLQLIPLRYCDVTVNLSEWMVEVGSDNVVAVWQDGSVIIQAVGYCVNI